MKEGLLILVSGPSGAGKGTICRKLLDELPSLSYSISATTRQMRPGEKDGVNYYFKTVEEFETMIRRDGLLEWAKVYDNYYGTPIEPIRKVLAEGRDILLEIDTQGALSVMERFPEGVYIFILPPSMQELERRIRGRGTEAEDILQKRLHAARKEIDDGKKYKYVIINREVDDAVAEIKAVLTAEKRLIKRNAALFERI
ncbi:guanylate kinase [Selenomonas sp. TAMA-11512]|uniref:guanylate kinase n=1 Tax=Selenomonas sp. TAMA-11512 TaxID=3095337 RepID=UPI00309067E5|nr:guanylate kinase [Selenomonas sp. TAMA-11512]